MDWVFNKCLPFKRWKIPWGAHTNEICCVCLCNETLDPVNCRELLDYQRTGSFSSTLLHGVSCLVGWLVKCSHSCVHPLHVCISTDALMFLPDACMCSFAQYTQSQVYQKFFNLFWLIDQFTIQMSTVCALCTHLWMCGYHLKVSKSSLHVKWSSTILYSTLNDGQGLRILNYDEHSLFNTCHNTYMHNKLWFPHE